MADKLSIFVTLVVAGIVFYMVVMVTAQLTDPARLCESTFGEEWKPAKNVTPPEDRWACEAPNGTVKQLPFVNVTNGAAVDYIGTLATYN